VQASSTWVPPGGTLGRILEETRKRVTSLNGGLSPSEPGQSAAGPRLAPALRGSMVAVVAEIKRKSPSKGVLAGSLDPGRQAAAFERGGAAAISVLTEPTWFDGSMADLSAVRAQVALPILRKDFHIDPLQLVEARAASATAVLLIARALPQAQLTRLMEFATKLGLEAIVEVRTEGELARALECGAKIVGVNSRDLETLEIDERVPERLMPLVPADVIGIWESGVHDVASVRRAADCGADAVLVGSALSKASDPAALVRELGSVARQSRRG
jgi:indole-3-glycerol phosphate synthase